MASVSSFVGAVGGSTIGSAAVRLVLDSKLYEEQLAAAKGTTESSVGTMGTSIGKFGGYAQVAMLAAGAAVIGFTVAGISKFEALGNSVRILEMQLGTTAEQASILKYQGDALGVSTDKLSTGFGIFAKHLVANDAAIQQYGITVAHNADRTLNFQAILAQLSQIFSSMPPGMERTAAAMNLFGRSGKSLLPLLSANSDQLAALAQNAEAAGLVMSQGDVDAAHALTIAQRELGAALQGLEVSLARAIIPLLTNLVNVVSGFVRVASPAAPLIRDIAVAFLAWKAFSFIPPLLLAIGSGLEAIGVTATSGGIVTAAASLTGIAAAAGPVGVVLAGAAGAAYGLSKASQYANDSITAAAVALNTYGVHSQEYRTALEEAGVSTHAAAEKNAELVKSIQDVAATLPSAGSALTAVGGQLQWTQGLAHEFAGMTATEFKDWASKVDADVSTVGDAFGALSSQTKVTTQDVIASLREQAKNWTDYAANLQTVLDMHLPDAMKQQIVDAGIGAAGEVAALADATKKQVGAISDAFKAAQGGIADVHSEVSALGAAISHLPASKQIAINVDVHYKQLGIPPPGSASGGVLPGLSAGALIGAAAGFVAPQPTYLVGEGSYSTPFGRGAEAVLPLSDSVLDKLGQAIAKHSAGGGGQVSLNFYGPTYGLDDFQSRVAAAIKSIAMSTASV